MRTGTSALGPGDSMPVRENVLSTTTTKASPPERPLLNPKGGLNAINDKLESEEEAANTDNEEAEQQLCELLIKVTDLKDEDIGKILDFCEEFDSDYKEEEFEEGELAEGWGSETETRNHQREMLSINTISDKEEDKEELPIKCKDPEVFTTADCSIVSAAGIVEDVIVKIGKLVIPTNFHVIKPPPGERGHPQVLLRRPFLKMSGFRPTYVDDIFTFSSGRTTETLQITPPLKKKNRQDEGRM
ncbi:hypothetical protein PIB30_065839 [Stylosanthes scabra]|uniref:Uncharacterized protein n=1 Tax=Stylosanthes scabra TaxID=79078 RepID=A0ABU6SM87_9FABA|nr:hypothetical protein [Stylosanthes scabra]